MASAFDDLTPYDAEYIRRRLLAGDSMAEIRLLHPGLSVRTMRKLRKEVFDPLINDASEVKKLAGGQILNPLAIIKYKGRRATKPERPPVQIEMFPS